MLGDITGYLGFVRSPLAVVLGRVGSKTVLLDSRPVMTRKRPWCTICWFAPRALIFGLAVFFKTLLAAAGVFILLRLRCVGSEVLACFRKELPCFRKELPSVSTTSFLNWTSWLSLPICARHMPTQNASAPPIWLAYPAEWEC